jgi:hypothetical protein
MAHQSDSLATRRYSGTLSASLRANKTGWHSFGYFSFANERKVTRPRCEYRNLLDVYNYKIKNNHKNIKLRNQKSHHKGGFSLLLKKYRVIRDPWHQNF